MHSNFKTKIHFHYKIYDRNIFLLWLLYVVSYTTTKIHLCCIFCMLIVMPKIVRGLMTRWKGGGIWGCTYNSWWRFISALIFILDPKSLFFVLYFFLVQTFFFNLVLKRTNYFLFLFLHLTRPSIPSMSTFSFLFMV